jgi:hypothetical protein
LHRWDRRLTVKYSSALSFFVVSQTASRNSSNPSRKIRVPTIITGIYPIMTGLINRTPMVMKANMIPANRLPPPAHFHAASDRMQQIKEQLSHIRQAIETVCKTLDDRFEQQEKRERLLDQNE